MESIEEINVKLNNENVKIDTVLEGKADINLSNEDGSFSAFYNPAQVYIYIHNKIGV